MFELFPGFNSTPMTELAMATPLAFQYGAPFAQDINSDGWLDLWHHNHHKIGGPNRRWSEPSTKKTRRIHGGVIVDWDAVIQDGAKGTYYAANGGSGFIHVNDDNSTNRRFDAHSSAFMDFDADGLKDLFIVTGGGRGLGNSESFDNVLFWGEEQLSSELGFKLVGGQQTALAANLDGRGKKNGNDRGRHLYVLSTSGDGKLDIITLNSERQDEGIRASRLHKNMGGRKFKTVKPGKTGFEEFALMAVLTDVDGDGYARELIVPSRCDLVRRYPRGDICARSPGGSLVVYRLDSKDLLVRESITPPIKDVGRAHVHAIAGSFDLDNDSFADVAVLWGQSVHFHLSSKRQKRCKRFPMDKRRQKCLLTLGKPDVDFKLKACGKDGAVQIRFADFNLDGSIKMLVLCKYLGHVLYELTSDGSWREMRKRSGRKRKLGDLNNPDLMLGGRDFCKGVPVTLTNEEKCQNVFSKRRCKKLHYKDQFIVCSHRAKVPKNRWVKAIGATVADINNDGFVDLIVSYKYGAVVMLRNTLRQEGRKQFIAVRLDRTAGAASSIGAVVTLRATRMGPFGNETVTQMRVLSTLSHETDDAGGHEDRLIFGLGEDGKAVSLSVKWPHCCKETVILSRNTKLWKWYNSMTEPFEVPPPPKNCDTSCFRHGAS